MSKCSEEYVYEITVQDDEIYYTKGLFRTFEEAEKIILEWDADCSIGDNDDYDEIIKIEKRKLGVICECIGVTVARYRRENKYDEEKDENYFVTTVLERHV